MNTELSSFNSSYITKEYPFKKAPISALPEKQLAFSPYADNGGTVVALAGADYAIVAGDTRMSTGYSIQTRKSSKSIQLSSKAVLASAGMQADQNTLQRLLQSRLISYQNKYNKEISTPSLAQMLSNTLYYKRFFPYYTFNVLGGLDDDGKGCVYGYDAVGSFERGYYACAGSGHELIQPLLDNQILRQHHTGGGLSLLSLDAGIDLIKDAFTSAGERDIYTGDYVEIFVITQRGVDKQVFNLKFD
eukprot:TRINITY_DN8399_c0_g1_i1.p1 TRINITY_DN8399_c0_g1~~TRINITY_DN8399_c0_g1_i1.p1  ORF type:complete len:259 (+),score=55.96 TRINITY_DN8399_c0_g1_i1:42-779(+)